MPAIVLPTALVQTVNVALAEPASTVTLTGAMTGSVLDNDTAAPPAGAAAVSVAVPVTDFPPTTLAELSEIEASATDCPVTVNIGD